MDPELSAGSHDSQSLTLAEDAGSPAAARRFVSDLVTDLPPDTAYDALVAVSELVTNSVRHGQAPITVRVTKAAGRTTIAVHDPGAGMPPVAPDAPPSAAPGGRGLLIVATVGARWGVDADPQPPGKTVWVMFPSGEQHP